MSQVIRMSFKKLFAAVIAVVLCTGMGITAQGAQNPFAYMEAQSRQAVEAAIKAGTVPAGTTIYDCMYGANQNGVTIVVQYRNKNGNWINVASQKPVESKPTAPAVDTEKPVASVDKPPADAKQPVGTQPDDYAAEVFRLINQERLKAGLSEVVWNAAFAGCAQIRAEELSRKYAHERPDPVNDGIDWPKNPSGIGIYNAPSVADEQGVPHEWIMENIATTHGTPEGVVKVWMDSAGHRKNILRESHIRCGVGVYKMGDGLYWALWFDDYSE
jgi:uncharacterized protein YkwD